MTSSLQETEGSKSWNQSNSGNRAHVEALMRRQLPALFGNVETSTEPPPARDPWVVRAAQSPVADSIMNAFTGTAEGVADAVTLPGDVLSGGYSLPPSDAPGISEDDGYNVYRDNRYIGNRLANQEGMIRRAIDLGGTFTGSGVATTAARGRKAMTDPNVLRAGGGGRCEPLHRRSTSTTYEFAGEIGNVFHTGASSKGKLFRDDLGEITIDLGVPGNPEKKFKGGWGLAHIRDKRTAEDGIDGDAFVRDVLPKVLSEGQLQLLRVYGPPDSRAADIVHGNYQASMRLHRFGNRETWLLTGFERR